jgi:hypothetical protein
MQAIFDYPASGEALYCEEECVAIRNDDWALIHTAINTAIDGATASFKPRGWKKALHLMREWGVLGTIATVIVALLGLTAAAFYQATSRLKEEAEFRGTAKETFKTTKERLGNIDTSLLEIKATLANYGLQRLAEHPANPKNGKEVEKLLESARAQNIRLDVDLIDRVGNTFVRAATNSSSAWNALLSLVSYRSFLAGTEAPQIHKEDLVAIKQPYKFTLLVRNPPGMTTAPSPNATLWGFGSASPLDSARLEPIVQPQAHGTGFQYLVVDDSTDTIVLDGMYAKNVIFQNMTFWYNNGPIKLDGVYFVNCRFVEFPDNEKSRTVLRAVARPPSNVDIKS